MRIRMAPLQWGALVLAVAIAAAAPAAGQALTNTTFDTNVDGWGAVGSSSISWAALDADGSVTSGSALVENDSASGVSASGASQCVVVFPGGLYDLGGSIRIPSGQIESGAAYLLVQWYPVSCGPDQISLDNSNIIPSSTPDQWLPTEKRVTAPGTANAARVSLYIWKTEAGGSLQAYFDNVYFVDVPDLILEDGFEDGTTDAWSVVQP